MTPDPAERSRTPKTPLKAGEPLDASTPLDDLDLRNMLTVAPGFQQLFWLFLTIILLPFASGNKSGVTCPNLSILDSTGPCIVTVGNQWLWSTMGCPSISSIIVLFHDSMILPVGLAAASQGIWWRMSPVQAMLLFESWGGRPPFMDMPWKQPQFMERHQERH